MHAPVAHRSKARRCISFILWAAFSDVRGNYPGAVDVHPHTHFVITSDESMVRSHDIDCHPNVSYTQCLIRRQVLVYNFARGIPNSFASARVFGQLTCKRQSNSLSDPSIVEFQYSCRRRERRESSNSSTWLLPSSSTFNETDSNLLKRSQASVIAETCCGLCGSKGMCSNILQRSPFSSWSTVVKPGMPAVVVSPRKGMR